MERRRYRRIVVLLRAKIISDTDIYSGFLETPSDYEGVNFYTFAGTVNNVSEEGMMMTVPNVAKLSFDIGSTVEVAFQIPSGERVNLKCKIQWIKSMASHNDISQCLGIKIMISSHLYNEFLKAGHNQIK